MLHYELYMYIFLAVTKQLYEQSSTPVCPIVSLSRGPKKLTIWLHFEGFRMAALIWNSMNGNDTYSFEEQGKCGLLFF